MNLQNLLGQMMNSTNPMQMLTSILNPQQRQMVSNFQNQPNEKQAEAIAKFCNERGISKQDLATIVNSLKK